MDPTRDLYHDGTEHFLRLQAASAAVRLVAPAATERAWVVSYPDGEERLDALTPEGEGVWRGSFPYREGSRVGYRFKAVVGGRVLWYSQAGASPTVPGFETDFAFSPHRPPAWVKEAVFYQVFPDRFRNGDPTNDVREGEWLYHNRPVRVRAWGDSPDPKTGFMEFYGGDLEGVRQAIPHLTHLGVNALYLTPIFESPSSHRYDTSDYTRVDPHLGTNELFAELVAELHRRGLRVILDGVFNHTGDRHPWMNRHGGHAEPGAYQGGPTRAYYTYTGEAPHEYLGWLGVSTLPKLDYGHPEVHERVYRAPDSIIRRWLEPPYHVDGWRLDVAHMMGEGGTDAGNHALMAGIRAAMREAHPEPYLLGEHYYEATAWLQGGEEDGAMNYHGFTWPTWAFLAGRDHRGHPARLDAAEYDAALRQARAKVPFENALAQLNLLGSHDLPRWATVCPDRGLRGIGVALLMTYPGAPCVYYGDEVGLTGGPDPDNRRAMPWNEAEWDQGTLELYRRLIGLRRGSRALTSGGFHTLHASGDAYAFERRYGEERVVVALTRGAATRLDLGLTGEWEDALSGSRHGGEVELPERSARVLRPGATVAR